MPLVYDEEVEAKFADPETPAIIPSANVSPKGTSQLALDELKTERFLSTIRDYYSYREGEISYKNKEQYSDADMLELFYEDRTWANNNTVSLGKDLYYIQGEDDELRRNQFAYINRVYQELPSFWNDPNRSFASWLVDNGLSLIADPINLIGFGVGGQIAKQSFKTSLRLGLREKAAKEINKRTIEAVALQSQKNLLKNAVIKGAKIEGTIGAITAGTHDYMLQSIALETGEQDERNLARTALTVGTGGLLGSTFGAGFSFGAFKMTTNRLKGKAIKELEELSYKGQSFNTGKALFKVMDQKYFENVGYSPIFGKDIKDDALTLHKKTTEVVEFETNVKIGRVDPMNIQKFPKDTRKIIRQEANKIRETLERQPKTMSDDMVDTLAASYQLDPKELKRITQKAGKEGKEIPAVILANHNQIIANAKTVDQLLKNYTQPNLSAQMKREIEDLLDAHRQVISESLADVDQVVANAAASLRMSGKSSKKVLAAKLKFQPTDPKMKKMLEGDKEAYYKAVAKLDTDDKIIEALQAVQDVSNWDIAAMYVNNTLLSSPDTHLINIISGLINSQVKPATLAYRGFLMRNTDAVRSKELIRQALDTWIYTFTGVNQAIKAAAKSFRVNRPILDSEALRFDAEYTQNILQRWINNAGATLSGTLGFEPKTPWLIEKVISPTISAPLRILTAGDEFMKQLTYRARAAAQVNSIIMREFPELLEPGVNRFSNNASPGYKKKFNELLDTYYTEQGQAVKSDTLKTPGLDPRDKLTVNSALHYARETTFTQPATSQAERVVKDKVVPYGDKQGGLTGGILNFARKYRWSRVMGLHFINTPSNLIRWNMQHIPGASKVQFQIKQMLKKNSKGEYVNPEAAAEANARIHMGYLLWTSAVGFAMTGKFTGGGPRDIEEKKALLKTGWRPYSYVRNDGTYIELNRLDPYFTPFFIAADVKDALDDWAGLGLTMGEDTKNSYLELSLATITSMWRNLESKFYTKGFIETINAVFGGTFGTSMDLSERAERFTAQQLTKIIPLSGALRYADRVRDDYERELITFSDRMSRVNPLDDPDELQPQRDVFGEKIARRKGWFFFTDSLPSSPFLVSKFKNTKANKFFKDHEVLIRPPAKTFKKKAGRLDSGKEFDLQSIFKGNQSAYDRWLELSGTIKRGGLTLKERIESEFDREDSVLNKLPNTNAQEFKVNYIKKIISDYRQAAKRQMLNEFPEIKEAYKGYVGEIKSLKKITQGE